MKTTTVLGYDASTNRQITSPDELQEICNSPDVTSTTDPWQASINEPSSLELAQQLARMTLEKEDLECRYNLLMEQQRQDLGQLYQSQGMQTQLIYLVLQMAKLLNWSTGYLIVQEKRQYSIVIKTPIAPVFLPLGEQWFAGLIEAFPMLSFGSSTGQEGGQNLDIITQLGTIYIQQHRPTENQVKCLNAAIELLTTADHPEVPVSLTDTLEQIQQRASQVSLKMIAHALQALHELRAQYGRCDEI
jgi:hypothetical protein